MAVAAGRAARALGCRRGPRAALTGGSRESILEEERRDGGLERAGGAPGLSSRATERSGLRPECGVLPPPSPRAILEPGLLWRRAGPRTLLREANAHPGKVAAALHAPLGGRSSQASLGEVAGARAGGRSEGPPVAPSAPSAFESFPRLARGCEGLDLPHPGVRPNLGATVAISGPREGGQDEGRVAKGEPEGETWQRFPQGPSALAPRVAAPGRTESALSRVGAGPRPRGWGPLPGCAVTGRPGAPPPSPSCPAAPWHLRSPPQHPASV